MHIEHHPLIAEFPEHREAIHILKQDNAHFARLASEYEVLDKAITRAENEDEFHGDIQLEDLKKMRLTLKDQIYTMIQSHAA